MNSFEKVGRTPNKEFNNVNDTFFKFNESNLASIQEQLQKYDDWINVLSDEKKKCEMLSQWAHCLLQELIVRRMQEHNTEGAEGAMVAINSPKTLQEYHTNMDIIHTIREKLRDVLAPESKSSSRTLLKAQTIQNKIDAFRVRMPLSQ